MWHLLEQLITVVVVGMFEFCSASAGRLDKEDKMICKYYCSGSMG